MSACLVTLAACNTTDPARVPDILALDAPTLAAELAGGRVSAVQVTRAALARIARVDQAGPAVNAIIEINPDALAIARDLDRRFQESGPAGPLHGLPVVLKANIDTGDAMASSAGSLALANHRAPDDAGLVRHLRAAGAVIIGKANLSEWANFRSSNSSSGWSSLGGQTRNPWVLNRNPCGSSSGSAAAVAARLVPLAVGTETDGSIVCPAGANGIVGIKPTHGSIPGDGIIPLAHSQDTAGPMATTVQGAALLLAVLQGRPDDTSLYELTRTSLAGLRLGVVRDHYGAGSFDAVDALLMQWLGWFAAEQAALIDPVALSVPDSIGDAEYQVLLYEFKADLDAYLADSGAPHRSLDALITFNADNAASVMPYFGQEIFLAAQAMDGLDSDGYREALEESGEAMRELLDAAFADNALDALIAPVNSPAWVTDWVNGDRFGLSSSTLAAVSGYPSIAVPGGLVQGLPVGIAIIGRPGSEELLVEIAARFELARGPFPAPAFIPALED